MLLAFALVYLLVIAFGQKANDNLVFEWVSKLTLETGILAQQFAEPDQGGITKDGASDYYLYSTGRRNCVGLLALFHLYPRQNLFFGQLSKVFQKQTDMINIEIQLPETMPQTVFSIAIPKVAKDMRKGRFDITHLTKQLDVNMHKFPGFPKSLCAMVEHAGLFYEVMAPHAGVFTSDVLAIFNSLHVTSDLDGPHSQTLRLTMILPSLTKYAAVETLIGLALTLVDQLASLRVTAEQAKLASEVRKVLHSKEISAAKRRAEDRRLAKEKAEEERLKRMTPEQRDKEKARKQKLAEQRLMKRRMKSM